jgi:hypothetical protein
VSRGQYKLAKGIVGKNGEIVLKEGEVRCPACERGVKPRKDGTPMAHMTTPGNTRNVPCVGSDPSYGGKHLSDFKMCPEHGEFLRPGGRVYGCGCQKESA